VVSRSEDCGNPNRVALLVVPITRSPHAAHPLMYPLLGGRDIPLPDAENSIALPHLVQPLLKVDLDNTRFCGDMPEECLWEIQRRVLLAMRESWAAPDERDRE